MRYFYTILITIIILTAISCHRANEKEHNLITISGKVINPNSNTVYLNRLDHFSFLKDTYLVDSISINNDNEFKFVVHKDSANLFTLSTEKFLPFTYQILRQNPERYNKGNCEKFYTAIPSFYISTEQTINIDWFDNPGVDSIVSVDKSAISQVIMRDFYLRSKKNDVENLDLDNKADLELMWQLLQKEIEHDLKIVDQKLITDTNSFNNYLYSEIYLGHLNYFLNWIEKFHSNVVQAAITSPNSKNLYSEILHKYYSHKWNQKSLEYFKFTERQVNHRMNIHLGSFKEFHKPTLKKKETAMKFLEGSDRKRYQSMIDLQLKNVL